MGEVYFRAALWLLRPLKVSSVQIIVRELTEVNPIYFSNMNPFNRFRAEKQHVY
jgi:hypothetical protein